MFNVDRIVTPLVTAAVGAALYLASAAVAVASPIPQTTHPPAAESPAKPALWVVKGPHATVYLFGTVHMLPKNTDWHSAAIDGAIHQSKELWLEVANADDMAAAQPLTQQLGLDAAHPLSTKLSKDQVASLDKVAKEAGIPAGESALEPLRPWLAAVSLSMAPLVKAGWDPNSGVEQTIKPEFTKAGKPVHGLETLEQQLHFFADLPQKTEVDYLDSTLKEFDGAAAKFQEIVDAWKIGDVSTIDKLLDGEFREKYPDLYQVLIVKRNQVWNVKIQELLQGVGTVLIAVGAGHLAGPDSVQSMLESAGYKVERQ